MVNIAPDSCDHIYYDEALNRSLYIFIMGLLDTANYYWETAWDYWEVIRDTVRNNREFKNRQVYPADPFTERVSVVRYQDGVREFWIPIPRHITPSSKTLLAITYLPKDDTGTIDYTDQLSPLLGPNHNMYGLHYRPSELIDDLPDGQLAFRFMDRNGDSLIWAFPKDDHIDLRGEPHHIIEDDTGCSDDTDYDTNE